MAGLVGYASSDEEDEVEQQSSMPQVPVSASERTKLSSAKDVKSHPSKVDEKEPLPGPRVEPGEEAPPIVGPARQDAAPVGPALPPAEAVMQPLPEPDDIDIPGQDHQPPGSPYTSERALIHDLTLPSVPNLDIPPSPPGSPPLGPSKKFEQFLELKRQGVHFNTKLESSAALKNPSVADKLMGFAGLDEPRSQYATTLPTDLWDPGSFPDWAFRDRLKKSRDKVAKSKEAEKTPGKARAVDFVPAKVGTSAKGSTSTAGGVSRGEKRKSGWK